LRIWETKMPKETQSNITQLQEKVIHYFSDRPANFPTGRPYNCCESILLTLADFLHVDSEMIPAIGTAIGAGVSLNGLLCGSVSGVAIAIGIKYGRKSTLENPEPAWKMMDEFLSVFKERFGYVNCSQLTGLNLKTTEGLKKYFTSVHDHECTKRLKLAVEKAVTILSS